MKKCMITLTLALLFARGVQAEPKPSSEKPLAEEEGIHVCQGTIWSQYGIDNMIHGLPRDANLATPAAILED